MPRDKFQAVKDVVPIELHIQKYEIGLKDEGDRLIGSHHKHGSKDKRCFIITISEQIFRCFNCGVTGSVIDYEMDRLGVDAYHAAESLIDEYKIDLPNETPEQRQARKVERESRIPVQDLLLKAFQLYNANLKSNNYFNDRGIPDKIIESDLLGYAPSEWRWLASRLEKVTDDRDALLGTGLFYKNRDGNLSDRYSDRYIFPYWYRGHPVFSIGRSIDTEVEDYKKYVKHLVKSDRYPYVSDTAVRHVLWGADKIRDNDKVLMAEGITDAILARQYFGGSYTIISPVTTRMSKAQVKELAQLSTRVKSITIAADSEENNAGEKGAIDSAENIRQQWYSIAKGNPESFRKKKVKTVDGEETEKVIYPETEIARLRRPPESEKRDLADFVTEGHIDELEYWIEAAQPLKYYQQRKESDVKRFFDGKTTFIAKHLIDECLLDSNYFLYSASQLHRYSDGAYQSDGPDFIRSYAKKVLGKVWTDPRNQALIDWLKDPVPPEKVNPDPNILNVENGLLNLKNHEIEPHTPYYLSNVRIPVTYKADSAWEVDSAGEPILNPESGNPKFTTAGKEIQRFITSVVPPDAVDLTHEMCGYCLSAQAKYDRGFILVGSGANGKGTLLNLISAMIGQDNISNVTAQDLCESRFKSAEIFGKLANICADIPASPITDTSQIKMIASGDSISAERKNQHPFQFRPFATLLFSANEIPRSKDKTHAFYRRWNFIPFPNKFEGKIEMKILLPVSLHPKTCLPSYASASRGLKGYGSKGTSRLASHPTP